MLDPCADDLQYLRDGLVAAAEELARGAQSRRTAWLLARKQAMAELGLRADIVDAIAATAKGLRDEVPRTRRYGSSSSDE